MPRCLFKPVSCCDLSLTMGHLLCVGLHCRKTKNSGVSLILDKATVGVADALPCRFAHEGILNCARAIRDDLKRLGLLDQLLLGHKPSGNGNSWTSMQQQQLQGSMTGTPFGSEQLPDCRGWTLVLTGHSLGKHTNLNEPAFGCLFCSALALNLLILTLALSLVAGLFSLIHQAVGSGASIASSGRSTCYVLHVLLHEFTAVYSSVSFLGCTADCTPMMLLICQAAWRQF